MSQSDRLLTFDQVSERAGMKRTAIYAAIQARTFPAPLKIGKLSRWLESDIDAWIARLRQSQRAA